jgi:hypothetical protein
MSCALININYNTRFAVFSIDNENDISNLPTLTECGKGTLSPVNNVSQGSKAIGTNGTDYILTGEGKWIKYNK